MAEWKTDTEEVKQIVKRCRDFKGSLQEEKCAQFIKDLDSYAREILLERRKIERQLQDAIEELRKAKKNRKGFFRSVVGFFRDAFDVVGEVIKPIKLGSKVCDVVLNLMGGNIGKWE